MTTAAKKQGSSQKDVVAGATLVTMNARVIIDQQAISTIKEIPNLPDHQAAAKKQSANWLNEIWPLIIKTTAEIIDYATTFQVMYKQLLVLIPKLEQGDQKAKDEFVSTLQGVLVAALQKKENTAKNIKDDIVKFASDFEELYQKFATDFDAANRVLTADEPKITEYQKEIDALNEKAKTFVKLIIVPAIAIPATIVGTMVLAATGVGLIIGGILLIGEIAALVTLIVEYAETMKQVHELTNKVADLKTEVAQLKTIEGQITSLKKNTDAVATAANSVAQGWVALSAEMANTLYHLTPLSPKDAAIVLKNELGTANRDWGVVLEQAKVLQPKGAQLEHKTVKTADDMVKAIKDQVKKA